MAQIQNGLMKMQTQICQINNENKGKSNYNKKNIFNFKMTINNNNNRKNNNLDFLEILKVFFYQDVQDSNKDEEKINN